jgi:hypothetical protein
MMATENKTIWNHRLSMAMVMLLLLVAAAPVNADNPETTEMDVAGYEDSNTDDEDTNFQNPTQARKAENLAVAEAVETDTELDRCLNELEAAKKSGDQTVIDAAEQKVADRIAEIAGMDHSETIDKIDQMREDGYGWGQIAHELGVHPSTLGLGHKYGHQNKSRHSVQSMHGFSKKGEIAAATMRDTKNGKGNKGHGVSSVGGGKGRGAKGADSFDSTNSGKGKGKSGDVGGGRGSGKGGGNGGGNSGGNGKK